MTVGNSRKWLLFFLSFFVKILLAVGASFTDVGSVILLCLRLVKIVLVVLWVSNEADNADVPC